MPFGVHRVHHSKTIKNKGNYGPRSPLPFGVHRVQHRTESLWWNFPQPLSPLPFGVHHMDPDPILSNDQTESPLPFGVLRIHHSPISSTPTISPSGLRCLSAFSAFTTRSRGSLLQPSHRVSIGFRRSLRSPRTYLFWHKLNKVVESPLPFGVYRVHHCGERSYQQDQAHVVSIAFRRSPQPLSNHL